MNDKIKSIKMKAFLGEFVFLSCAFAVIAVMIGYSYSVITSPPDKDVSAELTVWSPVFVIDPGHGGEDGGAVAADGTVEKDLNLEYAITLKNMCDVLGIDAVLTRDTDTLLYDKYSDLQDYTGKKKVYDLKNRLRFTKEAGENTVFVGIHMNKFSDPKYSGTQIYYSPNSGDSQALAQLIRDTIRNTVQPENERQIKKAGSSIFLLNRLDIPAVLAECGFLSNDEETARLKNDTYKKEFSITVTTALGEFINQKNG